MCSIVLSYNRNKFIELMEYNQKRGNFSFSVAEFNQIEGIRSIYKDFGLFDKKVVSDRDNNDSLFIGHVQAPTGGLIQDINRIHPSVIGEPIPHSWMWHNGILKETEIINLQNHLMFEDESWDTKLLHNIISIGGFKELNDIDGSFGCILINRYPISYKIYLFTNAIISMYIDDEFNISSTEFPGSEKIEPNLVYDITYGELRPITAFESKSSPYYFPKYNRKRRS